MLSRGEQFPTLLCSLRYHLLYLCVNIAADLGVDVNLCEKEVTTESSGEFLSPSRYGPGSCLRILVELLLKTHNGLVREARRVSLQEDRSVQLIQSHVHQVQDCQVRNKSHQFGAQFGQVNTLFFRSSRPFRKPFYCLAGCIILLKEVNSIRE